MPRKPKSPAKIVSPEFDGMPEPIRVWPEKIGGREVQEAGISFSGRYILPRNELGASLGEAAARNGNVVSLTAVFRVVGHADKDKIRQGESGGLAITANLSVGRITHVDVIEWGPEGDEGVADVEQLPIPDADPLSWDDEDGEDPE